MNESRDRAANVRAACSRALLLAFGWWALTEGAPSSLAFGIPVVAAATLASLATTAPRSLRLRPRAFAWLVGTFLSGSFRGGWDVARRALSPRLPLSPVLIHYSMRLEPGFEQRVFTSLVTLMPGTLSADVLGQDVRIHALVARGEALRRGIVALETRVARAFGVPIEETEVFGA